MLDSARKGWKRLVGAIVWLIVFLFGSLAGAVDYFQRGLPLQAAYQQASALEIILIVIGVSGFSVIVWDVFRRNMRTSETDIRRSIEKGMVRAQGLADVTKSLRIHRQGVIARMELWDYHPRDSGEMISTKGTMPGPTFGSKGPTIAYGAAQGIPTNLEKDKMHLKEFQEPWKLYNDGPQLYGQAKELEEKTSQLVRSYLLGPITELQDWRENNYLDKFAESIIDNADRKYKGGADRNFEAVTLLVNGQPFPAVGERPIYKGTLADAQKLSTIMNEIRSRPDVKDAVGKRREAWDAVLRNKNDFLLALKETVIDPARSSNYSDPRLVKGSCDDCRSLKDREASLAGE